MVVKPERTLFRHSCYYLVTSLSKAVYSGVSLAAMYGRRGKAAMHQGEMKAAAASMSLSSSPRAKSRYRNRIIKRKEQTEQAEQTTSGAVRAQNAAMLQIFMLVYPLLHCLAQRAGSTGGMPRLGNRRRPFERRGGYGSHAAGMFG